MRNLKKVLALVLAMAMALSLAVTAGAAFNDQDKIVNTDAVDMCTALNIINGFEDNTFRPTDNVTRGQAAKMITIALNGGKEPVLSASATPTYTDTANHWAAKYIEYCTSLGIVAGDGAGKFNPNGNVKAVELAKMLLIALGYNADTEKFVGANWDTNVNVIASQKDIYEDLESIDPSVAATRDVAAQMVWNALKAKMVDYDYKLSTDANGNLVSELKVEDEPFTLMAKKYSAQTSDAAVMTKYEWVEDDAEYKYTFGTGNNAVTYVTADDYTDLYAMKVSVVYKVDADGNAILDKVYGMFAEDSAVLYEGIIADIEDGEDEFIEIDGTEYEVADNAAPALSDITAYAENYYAGGAALNTIDGAYTMRVIGNDDGEVVCVVYLPFTYGQVDYVGTKSITVDNSVGTLTFEDNDIYEGVAKDDYVVVVDDKYTAVAKTGTYTVSKMDSVAGDVTAVKGTYDVQIDGTWYDVQKTGSAASDFSLNEEYTLYVVGPYAYYAEEGENTLTLDNLLYVEAAELGDSIAAAKAKVVFADGETATVELTGSFFNGSTETNYGVDTIAAIRNELCTFEIDDGEYELTLVNSSNDLGYDQVVVGETVGVTANPDGDDEGVITYASSQAVIADDAVIFMVEDDDVTIKAGADLKDYKTALVGSDSLTGSVLMDKINGVYTARVALIHTGDIPNAAGTTGNYGYVVSEGYTVVKSGDDYYAEYTIWNGKADVVVREELSSKTDTSVIAEGKIISYTDMGENVIADVVVINDLGTCYKQAVSGIAGKTLFMIDDTDKTSTSEDYSAITATSKKITEDTIILYIDSDAVAGAEGGSVQMAREVVNGGMYNLVENVIWYDEATMDGELELLVVDINNEMK